MKRPSRHGGEQRSRGVLLRAAAARGGRSRPAVRRRGGGAWVGAGAAVVAAVESPARGAVGGAGPGALTAAGAGSKSRSASVAERRFQPYPSSGEPRASRHSAQHAVLFEGSKSGTAECGLRGGAVRGDHARLAGDGSDGPQPTVKEVGPCDGKNERRLRQLRPHEVFQEADVCPSLRRILTLFAGAMPKGAKGLISRSADGEIVLRPRLVTAASRAVRIAAEMLVLLRNSPATAADGGVEHLWRSAALPLLLWLTAPPPDLLKCIQKAWTAAARKVEKLPRRVARPEESDANLAALCETAIALAFAAHNGNVAAERAAEESAETEDQAVESGVADSVHAAETTFAPGRPRRALDPSAAWRAQAAQVLLPHSSPDTAGAKSGAGLSRELQVIYKDGSGGPECCAATLPEIARRDVHPDSLQVMLPDGTDAAGGGDGGAGGETAGGNSAGGNSGSVCGFGLSGSSQRPPRGLSMPLWKRGFNGMLYYLWLLRPSPPPGDAPQFRVLFSLRDFDAAELDPAVVRVAAPQIAQCCTRLFVQALSLLLHFPLELWHSPARPWVRSSSELPDDLVAAIYLLVADLVQNVATYAGNAAWAADADDPGGWAAAWLSAAGDPPPDSVLRSPRVEAAMRFAWRVAVLAFADIAEHRDVAAAHLRMPQEKNACFPPSGNDGSLGSQPAPPPAGVATKTCLR